MLHLQRCGWKRRRLRGGVAAQPSNGSGEEPACDDCSMPETTGECPRCGGVLTPSQSPPSIFFYECPRCHRRYARSPGEALHERWPGPLSLVLYGVIFEQRPQDSAARIAGLFVDDPRRDDIVAEIRLELREPSQSVREILDLRASETDLREFLALVADQISGPPISP